MSAIVVQTEFLGKAHMLPNFSHLRNKGKKKRTKGASFARSALHLHCDFSSGFVNFNEFILEET